MPHYDRIPDELKALRQWVCWRIEERYDRDGNAKPTKVPINPRSRSGAFASSTDPETWSSFEKAVARSERYDGIGFVFTKDDPYIGIDIDDGFGGLPAGELPAFALRFDTYAEWSPSGKGVHIIGKGRPPGERGGTRKGGIEVYPHSRFFTMTGNAIDGTNPNVLDIQPVINDQWEEWFPPKAEVATPIPVAWGAGDDDVLERLRSAKNATKFEALYNRGDVSGNNNNDSEADLALCSMIAFYTQDPAQIDRIFRSSRLYREKWEREGYRNMTISRALERAEYYAPPANDAVGIRLIRSAMDDIDPDSGEITQKTTEIPTFNMTDKGNARRLAYHAADRLRYVPEWGMWLVWDGTRWVRDTLGQAMEVAKAVQETIYEEASAIPDEKASAKMRDWAVKSESGQRLREMLGLAASDPVFAMESRRFDRDPMLLNVKNGTIDLHTGELRPHRREDLLTRIAPVHYDASASCERWESFLSEITGGDAGLVEYLQRAVGYTITGDITERKMFIAHGPTTTGKSTFLDTIAKMLGDYARRSPNDLMVARKPGERAIPHEVAQLVGIRFTWISETGEFDRLDEAKVKDLVSGDVLSARLLHQNLFEFRPTFKLWAGTNHKPVIRASDDAVWKRTNLIPFTVQFTDDQIDYALSDKLDREMPGILAWAVRGCLAWQRVGMEPNARVKAETEAYRETMDVIGSFLREECVVRDVSSAPVSEVYAAYREWAEANGERPMTKKAFSMRMTERGITSSRVGRQNTYTYTGVRLRTAMDDDDDLDTVEMPAWMRGVNLEGDA